MKSRAEEDRVLVGQVQAGDTHAFDLLMQHYRPRLTRFLLRFMRDTDDAEDVAQDTFIKAYRAIGRFRGDSSFATWIFQIGINTAKQGLASRKRHGYRPSHSGSEGEEGMEPGEAEADFDTPESQLESQEVLHVLDAALDALPDEQRRAFELRAIEGLSYDEIALAMDCPVGTVRSRIHRARDTLAAVLNLH